MTGWTSAELDRIGFAEELQVITSRRDGTHRQPVPVWVVRVGDEEYVRSFRDPDGAWYRHASQHPASSCLPRRWPRSTRSARARMAAPDPTPISTRESD